MRIAAFWALCLSLVCAPAAQAQSVRTVSVVGNAKASVYPDEATWRLNLNARSPDIHEAKRQSDALIQQITLSADRLGVPEADREMGKARIDRVYEQDKNYNERKFRYFSLSRTFVIHQRDLARFEQYFDELVVDAESGAELRYSVSNAQAIVDSLRLAAVDNARVKAEGMAAQLGASLGPVVLISEYRPADPLHSIRDLEEQLSKQSGVIDLGWRLPEAVEMSSQVYVTFELR